jgi:endonuclease YncB( thermonuclease family)
MSAGPSGPDGFALAVDRHVPDLRPALTRRPILGLIACVAFGAALPARARAPAASPAPIEGVALDVQDGDSFDFRGVDGLRRRIRVSGIDAPERRQPFADASRRSLGTLLRGRRLRIEPVKQDAFDRTVARVLVLDDEAPPRDAGLAQLEAGLAWHFVRYLADQPIDDRQRYARAERDARAARAGLWRDDAPEPPWDFRSRTRRREGAPAAPPPPGRAG